MCSAPRAGRKFGLAICEWSWPKPTGAETACDGRRPGKVWSHDMHRGPPQLVKQALILTFYHIVVTRKQNCEYYRGIEIEIFMFLRIYSYLHLLICYLKWPFRSNCRQTTRYTKTLFTLIFNYLAVAVFHFQGIASNEPSLPVQKLHFDFGLPRYVSVAKLSMHEIIHGLKKVATLQTFAWPLRRGGQLKKIIHHFNSPRLKLRA